MAEKARVNSENAGQAQGASSDLSTMFSQHEESDDELAIFGGVVGDDTAGEGVRAGPGGAKPDDLVDEDLDGERPEGLQDVSR